MKKAPISILMSVYQKEKTKYFTEAIESILAQTIQPEEIFLVIDGPLTTELDTIIANYKRCLGHQLTICKLKQNQGLGVALAKGVSLCRNELIARMDADDIMVNNRLEIQLKEFQEEPNLVIIGTDIIEFSHNIENVTGKRIVPKTNEEIRAFSKKRNPFNHMTVMYKKSAILAVGNYLPLKGFEDYYLWVRLLKKGYEGKNIANILVYARAGDKMYMRRGGVSYLFPGLRGRWYIYKDGIGNFIDYMLSSTVHVVISLMPNRFRGLFYKKILRK
ncbi:glycosyltransferase [Melissococcus plutonius]|uniref:Glycosyltransferase 2-like domain-containing protein n=1 Tax=Melissococcus plutonius (strain ATCC 35311 / DSM 29964 / CIP 104052 / LMG 20360 / NCIMB 702443) TaxID=940190 RepID=F3Y9V4_MELPT|nr:glycosyltransferase [Melissococcus plutonius]AIM24811.1 glycosyltransferase [Melissococcus plutonius S1]KMT24930.1 glycosyltransferase [Melissococcus plutonius]KMT26567.1 glycosyltransferase [Melissococcus plutonius]KMT27817.1 glycosyltransferase [Melissococcus plutonius]KMT29589.1 glycosyltransferase [Melissococcus plutonius]